MKKKKQVLTIALTLTLLVGLMPMRAAAVDETYKYWDQGDFRWGSMSLSPSGYGPSMALQGCYVTAVAKLLVHAGQQDQTTFTPQKCLEGMHRHNMLDAGGGMYYNNFNNGFLQEFGRDLEKILYTDSRDMDKATAIREVSKEINDGYYVIVYVKSQWGASEHYMAVDYVSDDIYVMDNNRVIALYREGPSYGYSNVKDLVRFKYHGDKPYPAIGGRIVSAEIQPGLYSLAPACAPDSRLEVADGSMEIQANVRIGNSNGDTAQQWEISALGDGYYKLISKKSGHALDVAGAGTTAGTNVQQYWWTENRAQHWCFIDAGDGYYQIATRLNTGLRLDVSGGAAANGTNVQIWTENGNAAQKWKLIPVSSKPDSGTTANPTPKTQYRYHRYEDGFGEFAVCAHYGNSLPTAAGPMYIKYTDWMDSPLPAVGSDYLVHPYQGASCINAGCVERTDSTTLRYRDSAGIIWYYEETRTVTEDKLTTTPTEPSKPTIPESPTPTTPETTPPTPVPVPNCDNGHTWGEWKVVVPATCNGDGQSERVCKVCGEVGVRITEALAHKYSVKQEADTFTLYVCANCGDSYAVEKEKKPEPEQPVPAGDMAHFVDDGTYVDGLFSDVKATDWYSANVSAAYGLGLMNGTGGNRFSPTNSLTLGEAVTLAARLHSIYYTGTEDFPRYDGGNWYDPYVDYAREKGIISENFHYALPATREEFVHILAAALPEIELPPVAATVTFADGSRIIYNDDVRLLQQAGVISGIREGDQLYFRPGNTITRAEVAAVITRLAKPELRKS